jgi:hypothetical protein
MTDEPIFYDCFLCKFPFRFGPHVYEGRYIWKWSLAICNHCYSDNWDGVDPSEHPDLIPHLKGHGVAIEKNERGWIDLPE